MQSLPLHSEDRLSFPVSSCRPSCSRCRCSPRSPLVSATQTPEQLSRVEQLRERAQADINKVEGELKRFVQSKLGAIHHGMEKLRRSDGARSLRLLLLVGRL